MLWPYAIGCHSPVLASTETSSYKRTNWLGIPSFGTYMNGYRRELKSKSKDKFRPE